MMSTTKVVLAEEKTLAALEYSSDEIVIPYSTPEFEMNLHLHVTCSEMTFFGISLATVNETSSPSEVAEALAQQMVTTFDDGGRKDDDDDDEPSGMTVSKIVISEDIWIREEHLSVLINALRNQQATLGWPEVEVWVLRPNGHLEYC